MKEKLTDGINQENGEKECRARMPQKEKAKIWVDDLRIPPAGYLWAKSVNQAIALIRQLEEEGTAIEVIDLDHDLGDFASDGGDAIKVLDFLAERETFYPIEIHTANPVGRANMERMLSRFWVTGDGSF